MIKAVVFDMDGLMIDTEKLLLRYWLEAAHNYGYDMRKEHALGIRSLAAKYAIPKLKARLELREKRPRQEAGPVFHIFS